MKWTDIDKKGKRMTFSVYRDSKLKEPNESIFWKVEGISFVSDIAVSCYELKTVVDFTHRKILGVGDSDWNLTYAERFIRVACSRKNPYLVLES